MKISVDVGKSMVVSGNKSYSIKLANIRTVLVAFRLQEVTGCLVFILLHLLQSRDWTAWALVLWLFMRVSYWRIEVRRLPPCQVAGPARFLKAIVLVRQLTHSCRPRYQLLSGMLLGPRPWQGLTSLLHTIPWWFLRSLASLRNLFPW